MCHNKNDTDLSSSFSVKSYLSVLLGPHMDTYKRQESRIPKEFQTAKWEEKLKFLCIKKILICEPAVVGKIVVLDNMSHVVTKRKSGQNHQDPVTCSYMFVNACVASVFTAGIKMFSDNNSGRLADKGDNTMCYMINTM